MAKVNSVLTLCDEKNEKDRKNQIIAFYSRKGRKPPVSRPTNEEEVLECISTASNAPGPPEEEDP